MYEFSKQLTITAKNYNLQERDIAFCYLIAAGMDRADAFYLLYNKGKNINSGTYTTIDSEAAKYYNSSPAFKLLVSKIKNRQQINNVGTQQEVKAEVINTIMEEEETPRQAELKTRDGLIRRFSRELANIHGKDSVQGLIQLAKLEGYDKEDNRTEEEKRRYFLPYRSRCRGCKLMHFYRDLEDKTQDQAPDDKQK